MKDTIEASDKIQNATDNHAGPGPEAWLRHIEYDEENNRARYVMANTALLARRAAPGMSSNACRCGRDVPQTNLAELPSPVAACTACSGVIVDIDHERVTNFVFNHARVPGPTNLVYGRRLPQV